MIPLHQARSSDLCLIKLDIRIAHAHDKREEVPAITCSTLPVFSIPWRTDKLMELRARVSFVAEYSFYDSIDLSDFN